MDKETLLQGFGERLGNTENGFYTQNGLSERTVETYVDAILPSVGETVDDAFYATHVAILGTMGGQLRHEKAEWIKSQKPTPPSPPNPKPSEETPSEVAELKAMLESITERLDKTAKAEQADKELRTLKSLMKEKGAQDEYCLKNVLKGYALPEGKKATDVVDDMLKAYDSEVKECRGIGATPRAGQHGGGKTDTAASRFFAKKAEKEGWGKSK